MKISHYSLIAISGIAIVGGLAFIILGTYQEQKLEIAGLKSEYMQGDPVIISVRYDGEKSGCQMPKIQVSNRTNPSQLYVNYTGGYHPDCPNKSQIQFYAGMDRDKSIDHTQDFHVLVKLGKTTFERDVTVYFDPKKKFYTTIDLPDIESTYSVNTAVNFTISLRGHGLFNARLIPQIQVLDQRGSTVWTSFDHSVVNCCPRELFDLSRDFTLSDIGNPLIINSAGTYTVQVNYDGTIAQKSFEVVLPETDCKDISKSISNITLKKYTWIAVSQIRQPFKADCIDVENIVPNTPKLAQAMLGADGCQDDTILCTIPKGISMDMLVTDTDLVVTDFEQYKVTLTNNEAQSITKKLGIIQQKTTPYKILKYNDKYYLLYFYTMNESPNPEAIMEFNPSTSYIPVRLEKNQSINYTILVKTLSTFGKDKAEIDFTGGIWTTDSMLDVKLEPSHLDLGERQQSKINMTISADKNAREGVYQTWVRGKIGDSYVGPWNNTIEFPNIQIGNSDWMIINPSGDGQSSMGGKSPPDWLRTKIRTDQDFYKSKNQTEIRVVLINTSDQKITLDSNRDLMVTISEPVINNSVKPIYGIRAYSYDSKNQITLEPKSEIVLARPFYWNQTKFSESMQYPSVEPGIYTIESYFSGHSPSIFYSQKRIGIGLDTVQSLLEIPKEDSFRGVTIRIPENASIAEPGTIKIDDVTITAGTQIRWKNEDIVMHSATAKPVHDVVEFDTDLIPPNKYSISITITKPGEYEYYDVLHPWIQGKIIVKNK